VLGESLGAVFGTVFERVDDLDGHPFADIVVTPDAETWSD